MEVRGWGEGEEGVAGGGEEGVGYEEGGAGGEVVGEVGC